MAYRYGDRSQLTLFPPCVEDYVPEDAAVRAYDAMVDAIDFEGLGIELNPDNVGSPQYDPKAMLNARHELKNVKFCADAYAAVKAADCLLVLTEWDEFLKIDLVKVRGLMRQPVVFDGRNFFDKKVFTDHGFEYYGIGRGDVAQNTTGVMCAKK